MASCVQYLRQQAPKVVLVGYSMGGLIVDTVVEDYSDSVLFAITIGSPHFHLPSFVMPRHLYVDGSSPKVDAAVPRLRIYAGPGDVLVPAISAWSVHTSRKSNLTLEVDLDNIPGVWGTSTHKGLVSCNQLVRQTVPLILDSIDLAYEGGSPDDIYTAMRGRMTSHIPFSLKMFEENGKQVSGRPQEAHNCQELRQPFQVVMSRPGIDICFIHTLKDGDDMDLMQILAHGMHPGVEFNLYGIRNDGYFEMSHNFSPLPALSVKEPKENKYVDACYNDRESHCRPLMTVVYVGDIGKMSFRELTGWKILPGFWRLVLQRCVIMGQNQSNCPFKAKSIRFLEKASWYHSSMKRIEYFDA